MKADYLKGRTGGKIRLIKGTLKLTPTKSGYLPTVGIEDFRLKESDA